MRVLPAKICSFYFAGPSSCMRVIFSKFLREMGNGIMTLDVTFFLMFLNQDKRFTLDFISLLALDQMSLNNSSLWALMFFLDLDLCL